MPPDTLTDPVQSLKTHLKPHSANAFTINFPLNLSPKARRNFKQKLIRQHRETLFTDIYHCSSIGLIKMNLIFHTERPEEWNSTLRAQLYISKTTTTPHSSKLTVSLPNRSSRRGNTFVTIYSNGTVLIQANNENLEAFDSLFPTLRSALPHLPRHAQTQFPPTSKRPQQESKSISSPSARLDSPHIPAHPLSVRSRPTRKNSSHSPIGYTLHCPVNPLCQ